MGLNGKHIETSNFSRTDYGTYRYKSLTASKCTSSCRIASRTTATALQTYYPNDENTKALADLIEKVDLLQKFSKRVKIKLAP